MDDFPILLKKYRELFQPVIKRDRGGVYQLDLSINNKELYQFDVGDTQQMEQYIQDKLVENDCFVAIGGYLENRLVYQRSSQFGTGENARSYHLGIDLWSPKGTGIHAPLDGRVHSFKNNEQYGDYGPTIILEHNLENRSFYTLYGHLSIASLENVFEGKMIMKGQEFAWLGGKNENGSWPPHLHFQLILDLQGLSGDYPGVSSKKDLEFYKTNCPDPELFFSNFSGARD